MATHNNNSQFSMILEHLRTGVELNPLEALNMFGVYRLGAVIYLLKKEGYNISSRLEYFKKPNGRTGHYAVYRLEGGNK